jgi:hypothetical protein
MKDRPIAEIVADLRARGMNYAADRFLEQAEYPECRIISALDWVGSPQGRDFWWYVECRVENPDDFKRYGEEQSE